MINEKQAFKKLLNYCLSNKEEFYINKKLQTELSNALYYLVNYEEYISEEYKQLFKKAEDLINEAKTNASKSIPENMIKKKPFSTLSWDEKVKIIQNHIENEEFIDAYNLLYNLKMPNHERRFISDIRNALISKVQADNSNKKIENIIEITPEALRPKIIELYEKQFIENKNIKKNKQNLDEYLETYEKLNKYKKLYTDYSSYDLIDFLSQAVKIYKNKSDLIKIVRLCPQNQQANFIYDKFIKPLLKDYKFIKAEEMFNFFKDFSNNDKYQKDLKKIDKLIQDSVNKYVLYILNDKISVETILNIKQNKKIIESITSERVEYAITFLKYKTSKELSNNILLLLEEKPQGFTNEIFKLLEEITDVELQKTTAEKIELELSQYINDIFNSYSLKVLEKQVLPKILQFPEPYKSKFLQRYDNLYRLYSNIESYNFIEADELFYKNTNLITKQNYLQIKSKSIKNYFSEILNININEEQADAISSLSQNNLLTARAGSGKTRTIACRAIYAIEKENIQPDEVLILAFNKKAAEETRKRIKEDFNYQTFLDGSSRTFHSLAYSIEKPVEDILIDNCNSEVEQKLSNFISELYHSTKIWTTDFKRLMYEYFYNDMKQDVIKHWQFTSAKDRYEYYRNIREITLQGELVKSNGEKWIADFLFEHGIPYRYESQFTSSKDGIYRPDFTINFNNSKILLEHWGIDEHDTAKKVPSHWTKTWQEYRNEIDWKRKLCKEKEQALIETNINDLTNGREHFENILKQKLEEHNIICTKIPFEKLIAIIDSKYKDDMAKKFATFIQAAHKSKLSATDILNIYQNYHLSDRANAFIELAVKVYDAFDKEILKQNKVDFDNMFSRAIEKASNTKCECKIKLGKESQSINKFKLLLIDEYQDFSDMFYELLYEMQKYNPKLKLFCVGDDWQAINGFAGSSLKYFNDYRKIFKNSAQYNLTTNYRSGNEIVQCGNNIMQNRGVPAKCYNLGIKSKLLKAYIDNVIIFNENNELDSEFIYDNSSYFDINHRYFKICYSIIKDNPQKTYLIMHRKSKLAGNCDLSDFKNAILNKLKKDRVFFKKENLEVDTIHKFKGKEADIAIILECDNENIPLIHPDNEIQIIFGKTPQDILDEERRLFYVAVTRAKECVYFLSEKEKEIDFVKNNENIKLVKIS